jgi:LysM repeat protein
MPGSRSLRIAGFLLLCLLIVSPTFAQDSATHIVQAGENLFRISLQYGVDIDSLAAANGISNTWQIYAGQTLVIPNAGSLVQPALDVQPVSDPTSMPAENPAPAISQYHAVQRGENLAAIARQYGMTPEALAQLNGLANPNLIYYGQELMVTAGIPADPALPPPEQPTQQPLADPAPADPAPAADTTYTVQPGDHLASIAAQYGISYLAIAQANNLYSADHIEVGQQLIIPGAAGGTSETGIIELPPAPAAITAAGRSIIVDLSDSRTYAYDNGILVRNVLVSTGLPGTPTVQGDFTVERKYVAQFMSGPGYYLPDVPYIMYFYQGYALHGTYWHNNFGVPMSHGCVNMPTPEAEWFYNWTDIGTPVHVQY